MSEGAPGDGVIRTPDQRLRVFVSSALGELAEERRAVARAVSALRLTPVMFELGAQPHPPREVYRAYLAQSDVFVGLYWQRYGQLAPGMEISGLEDEFELARGMPRLLYVKAPAPDREPRLADLLGRIALQVSYRRFATPAELGRLVRDDLAVLLSERFTAGPAARAAPSRERGPRLLPAGTTSLVGREQAIGEVAALVTDPQVRLVTLTGPGGVGKTRLALAVGERLQGRFAGGAVFVPLAAVTDPGQVLAGIARAEATAAVAGLEEGRALDLTEALVRHSLVQLDPAGAGPRCRMLETVRVFVAERLAARADAAEVRRRHAGYYRALAGEAEPHLRGVGQAEWLDRLQAEAGNLAAAVDWYLSHDRAPLPHLFRALLPYWLLASDISGQARAWIGQLLPAADSLDPQARAELLWAAAATANQAGDGAAALAASQQLEPLLAELRDPYLHAVSQLAMSWAATISGDLDSAIRQASASLEELRAQDEHAARHGTPRAPDAAARAA